ncbi:MAG: BREX-2 system adenine-specific DNA-methyltransferase PglX, partial [Acidobacteria bacterium]|nr:BREX-2 system adenine-specific DNA-methyltransferase PglX [Acidobacteriota bacterium]
MLNELTGLLRLLQDDLRMRVTEKPELLDGFQPRYEAMLRDKRTAAPLESWLEGEFTQIAVHWILACVFIRYCEDQALIEETYISGPNGKWRDGQEALTRYFRQFPAHSEREYLLHVFQAVSSLPALSELFHQRHNPLWSLGPSGDACRELLNTFQRTDENGQLVLRFDTLKTTRFLGDLYQDLSEYAKKQFALLQTPDFVESFILDHTLEPALASFGYQQTKLIDPTCGSGHFLIGGFQRLLREVRLHEPALNPIAQVQKALSGVFGVDINPFAVAIAHFRLIVEALRESGVRQLKAAPAFQINLARGDSLFHKELDGLGGDTLQMELLGEGKFDQYYESEDTPELRRILFQKYEAVVGNPPYITVKDANLNKAYRHKYRTCHMKYSMGVPFTERFFELARRGERGAPAGYMGVITTNSFMKREFGVKLIQEYLPKLQLNAIIDTSGAYIPGHGTPTVILFGQNQAPHSDQILVLQGIKGEPSTPDDPSQGLVWCDILHGYNQKQFAGEFISAGWNARSQFASHPWSLTGGGADEVQKTINDSAKMLLHDVSLSIGFGAILGEDDAFTARINSIKSSLIKPLVPGEVIRDWVLATCLSVIFPYDEQNDFKLVPLEHLPFPERFWKLRTYLFDRKDFSKKTYREIGRPYFEYHQIPTKRYRNPLSIAFAFVASHNHFVLDRGGKVFKQTAPVIKLPDSASLADHLALLGLLNSSSACFWMKQTCFNKGGGGAVWAERFEHDGSKLLKFPVPELKPLDLATRLDRLASELAQV